MKPGDHRTSWLGLCSNCGADLAPDHVCEPVHPAGPDVHHLRTGGTLDETACGAPYHAVRASNDWRLVTCETCKARGERPTSRG